MHSPSVTIQITPDSKPAMPSWMGEGAAFAQVLTHPGMLKTIQEQVRFARARFGQYDLIDFVAVLIGYVLSGESTLLAFYDWLTPFASEFMALFGRNRLPHRSTLSRFLAALDLPTVEALRTRFQEDGLASKPFPSPGSLFDRTGNMSPCTYASNRCTTRLPPASRFAYLIKPENRMRMVRIRYDEVRRLETRLNIVWLDTHRPRHGSAVPGSAARTVAIERHFARRLQSEQSAYLGKQHSLPAQSHGRPWSETRRGCSSGT